jgi:cytochrome c oxidase assembly factor CtaG
MIHGRYSAGAKALYMFAAFVLASPLGLVLALVPTPIYAFYENAPRTWGPGPLGDQQLAGVTMAVEQAIVFAAVFAAMLRRFFEDEQASGLTRNAAAGSVPPRH